MTRVSARQVASANVCISEINAFLMWDSRCLHMVSARVVVNLGHRGQPSCKATQPTLGAGFQDSD